MGVIVAVSLVLVPRARRAVGVNELVDKVRQLDWYLRTRQRQWW